MNVEDFRAYCLSFEGVIEKMPFQKSHSDYDKGILAFYVMDKWFCFANIDVFDLCDVKCRVENHDELMEKYKGIVPAYHMNHKHWIGIRFDMDVPDSEIKRLVAESYRLVVDSMPACKRKNTAV
jgi:predicted DNA-binding protein (MmcQ/YjbR family)